MSLETPSSEDTDCRHFLQVNVNASSDANPFAPAPVSWIHMPSQCIPVGWTSCANHCTPFSFCGRVVWLACVRKTRSKRRINMMFMQLHRKENLFNQVRTAIRSRLFFPSWYFMYSNISISISIFAYRWMQYSTICCSSLSVPSQQHSPSCHSPMVVTLYRRSGWFGCLTVHIRIWEWQAHNWCFLRGGCCM